MQSITDYETNYSSLHRIVLPQEYSEIHSTSVQDMIVGPSASSVDLIWKLIMDQIMPVGSSQFMYPIYS